MMESGTWSVSTLPHFSLETPCSSLRSYIQRRETPLQIFR